MSPRLSFPVQRWVVLLTALSLMSCQTLGQKLVRIEQLEQEESRLQSEVVKDLMLKGDAYFSDYAFAPALEAYEEALGHVRAEDSPELWAQLQESRAEALRELGMRSEGQSRETRLTASVEAWRQALKLYMRKQRTEKQAWVQQELDETLGILAMPPPR